jgi:hypothetical protein
MMPKASDLAEANCRMNKSSIIRATIAATALCLTAEANPPAANPPFSSNSTAVGIPAESGATPSDYINPNDLAWDRHPEAFGPATNAGLYSASIDPTPTGNAAQTDAPTFSEAWGVQVPILPVACIIAPLLAGGLFVLHAVRRRLKEQSRGGVTKNWP